MFSPGGLLRYLYGAVEGELIRSDAPAAETSPQAASPLHPAANDDQDDEEAMDYEDQKEFLKWEVKLASRTAGTHDFEARDPALSNTGREKVAAQLRFVDRQVMSSSPALHICLLDAYPKFLDLYSSRNSRRGRPVPEVTLRESLGLCLGRSLRISL